ncbi:MAG: carbamate kinase [Rhodoferax sp.]|jgi:carbamate kinase|nr:carbamate kinase [Rhodoferax sp.]
MRVVVALGSDALLRPGRVVSADSLGVAVRAAAQVLATIAQGHGLLVTHGRGPQEALLAQQGPGAANTANLPINPATGAGEADVAALLLQELAHQLGPDRVVRSVWTQAGVNRNDPAFGRPSHALGPLYSQDEAQRLAASRQWSTAACGAGFRRVVAAPLPVRVCGLAAIEQLLADHVVVVASGGGGKPLAAAVGDLQDQAVDAVVDPDLFSGVLAHAVGADCLIFATGVPGSIVDPVASGALLAGPTTPRALASLHFARGSIGQQAQAASQFVIDGGQRAAIGSLAQLPALLDGSVGIQVTQAATEPF